MFRRQHVHRPEEDQQLAREPRGERDADQAEQEQRHDQRHHRMATAQARQVVNGVYRRLRRVDVGQDREGAHRHGPVSDEVKQDRFDAVRLDRAIAAAQVGRDRQAHQHVARVRHAGIGEDAFQVVLQQGQDVAQEHCYDRQEPQYRGHLSAERHADKAPARLDARRLDPRRGHEAQHPQQRREARHLGHVGQQRGPHRRRTLIHVWRVEVERHRRDAEAQARQHHDDRDVRDRRQVAGVAAVQRVEQRRQVGRAGQAVEVAEAEQR